MPDIRLIHDCSFATTKAVLEVFALDEREYREAFDQVIEIIKAGFHTYAEFKAREMVRLAKAQPDTN
jgi:hypothetical protein